MDSPNIRAQPRPAWRVGVPHGHSLRWLHFTALVGTARPRLFTPPLAAHLDLLSRRGHTLCLGSHLRMGGPQTCCFLSSAFSVGWNFHRLRVASCMGGDVWHGDFASRIDCHDRSYLVDDELASLPDPWLAHWTGSLGAPRRFDSPRSRPPDHPDYPARYTLTTHCVHSLSHWLWRHLFILYIIQPHHWRHTHAEYVLRQAG